MPASPLQELSSSFLDQAGIHLLVKRDDLLHPEFGGNKWRKLRYNLQAASNQNVKTLLTFGGAWSNHIYATAAAGKYFGFNTIGLIRGEKHSPLNPTLQFATRSGMQLDYIDRQTYRIKGEKSFLARLQKQYGEFYLIPEGGSNLLALNGCKEMVDEIDNRFDVICCASGTGATLAGFITGLRPEQKAIGFSALKGGNFLNSEVAGFLSQAHCHHTNWHIETGYHFGGYAKTNTTLFQFMQAFENEYAIPLDCVYTAKMFYGLFDLIKAGYFSAGSVIIAVHTGGLQGNAGFIQKAGRNAS